MRRALIGLLGGLACAGCGGEPELMEYRAVVRAVSEDDSPLQGVTVEVDRSPAGVTGPDGELRLALRGREGQSVPLSAQCPENYRLQTPPRQVTLRAVRGLEADSIVPLQVAVACSPTRRQAVLLVRAADREGLPVMLDEQEVAQTSAKGVAHVLLDARPGRRIEVRLDTSEHESLRPQNPRRVFVFPDAPEVFMFDQQFEREQPRPKRRRFRRRRPTQMRGPTPL